MGHPGQPGPEDSEFALSLHHRGWISESPGAQTRLPVNREPWNKRMAVLTVQLAQLGQTHAVTNPSTGVTADPDNMDLGGKVSHSSHNARLHSSPGSH